MRWLVAIFLCLCWSSWASAKSSGDTLCSIAPKSYAAAKKEYPDFKDALSTLEKRGIATWYSDRSVNGDALETTKEALSECAESTRVTLVIYALPNKDCEAGYSNNNSFVKTPEDYADFIDALVTVVGTRKMLYVLEPDAVGLLVNGGCAVTAKYQENLVVAIKKLTASNPNAEIYLDVGFWSLLDENRALKLAGIIKTLAKAGNGGVKGITLNTSNYRPTTEMATLCTTFQAAYKSTDLHCIIDTSRNFNETSSEEWCNRRTGGIGHPPTGDTGIANIDYFVWIKPPGESDGECNNGEHTSEAMIGPEAGQFFSLHFELLWNNGYLHQVKKMAGINTATNSGSIGSAVIVVLVVIAVVAIGFIGLIVYRRRQNTKVERSRAYRS